MKMKTQRTAHILLFVACLSIYFPLCKKSQEKPDEVSSMSRFEQMSDSELNNADSLGKTLLHHAVKDGDTSLIEYLLKRGVDVHAQNADLNTPLHLAVFTNDIQSVEMLFFNGAHSDVLTENEKKITPFNYAAQNRYYAMAELLYFPMHYIIKRNKTEYFDYLVQTQKDAVSQADMTKMTPLHIAHLFQNQYFIDRLSESGADNDAVDVYGKKPSDYATMDFLEQAKENKLDDITRIKVDDKVFDFLLHYDWIAVGIVQDGEIAYLRTFGKRGMLEKDAVYASVSKPVTSIIFVQLLKQGLIQDLDDRVFDYSKKYSQDVMPEQYSNADLTFKHLLTHQSGIPHIDKPLWKDGKLNIQRTDLPSWVKLWRR